MCPDDGYVITELGNVSYATNEGFAYQLFGANGIARDFFPINGKWIRGADVSDGLSNTACLSERLVDIQSNSNDEARQRPLRSYWLVGDKNRGKSLSAVKALLEQCATDRTSAIPHTLFGANQYLQLDIGYNHMLGPNRAPCHQNFAVGGFIPLESVLPPSSLHANSVNLLLLDGSVHVISDAIDVEAWHALGTRAGGESNVISLD